MRSILIALVVLVISAPNVMHAQAATCPPGSRGVTAQEVGLARARGADIPVNATCIDKYIDDKFLKGTLQQDIEYLSARVCPTLNGKPLRYGIPSGFNASNDDPKNWNAIRQGYVYFSAGEAAMNPGALKCFRQFFEAAEKQQMQPCITAAFRTPAHQRSSCMDPGNSTVCGRSGSGTGSASSCRTDLSSYKSCPHTNGIAMDINDKTGKLTQLLAMARSYNGFTKVGAGAADPWHVEAGGCADANFKPTFNGSDSWTAPSTPTSALSNFFRSALGVPTQPNTFAQPSPLSQALTSAQPLLSSFAQPQITTPSISTSPSGVSNLLPSATTQTATGTSIADRLQELAFGIVATSATSGVPFIPLFINPNDRSDRVATQTVATATKTTTTYTSQPQSQTFTSNDLWYGGSTVNANTSGFTGVLANLRTILQSLLEKLRPFRNQQVKYVEGE